MFAIPYAQLRLTVNLVKPQIRSVYTYADIVITSLGPCLHRHTVYHFGDSISFKIAESIIQRLKSD